MRITSNVRGVSNYLEGLLRRSKRLVIALFEEVPCWFESLIAADLKYFTELKDVRLLQSLSTHVRKAAQYESPAPRAEFLISYRPGSPPAERLAQALLKAAEHKPGVRLVSLRGRYPKYEYADLAAHRGIVVIPYTVSFMSLVEWYRMGIPLFVPSLSMLLEWQATSQRDPSKSLDPLIERTWHQILTGERPKGSPISKHPNATSLLLGDPNNVLSRDANLEWLRLADFLQWPHVIQFDSFGGLLHRLRDATPSVLKATSNAMRLHSADVEAKVLAGWRRIADGVAEAKRLRTTAVSGAEPMDFDRAMRAYYHLDTKTIHQLWPTTADGGKSSSSAVLQEKVKKGWTTFHCNGECCAAPSRANRSCIISNACLIGGRWTAFVEAGQREPLPRWLPTPWFRIPQHPPQSMRQVVCEARHACGRPTRTMPGLTLAVEYEHYNIVRETGELLESCLTVSPRSTPSPL